ncbi:DUF4175 domain-containing protein [Bombella sp. TMW 2.2559]|uniref:DUF4175 domain-containing protein n=1 Tax=Bombella dulcis TaxID=2967339 RepID=A0ABT3W940_9PROT|nr:DUF4175 family protein [Bombella dulcis]MCX5615597.1 DUF4175 domain-containing protein [Bombella dulcis]
MNFSHRKPSPTGWPIPDIVKAALLPPRFARLKRQAYRRLRVEQYWYHARWPALLAGLWGCAALLHLPQSLPDWLHGLLELACFGTVIGWAVRCLHHLPRPTLKQVDQRIERDSGLGFPPLAALTDSPALPGNLPEDQKLREGQLWAIHRQRLLASLETLHLRPPRFFPHWAGWLTASLVVAGLFVLGCFSGTQAGLQLKAGFIPGMDDDATPIPAMQVWIDRPSYAPGPPLFLSAHGTAPLSLPEGAQLHVVVEAPAGRPSLHGAAHVRHMHLHNGGWQIESILQKSATVTLSIRGRRLGRWSMQISPDTPPDVRWTGRAGAKDQDWYTSFPWSVAQPHGVAELEVQLQPIIPPSRQADPKYRLVRPLPLEKHPSRAKGETRLDLSDSPFAGLDVVGALCAKSGSGKQSCSQPQTFRLGHRPFHDPLSRALLELRLHLATGQANQTQAAHMLGLLTALPLPTDLSFPLVLLQHQAAGNLSVSALNDQLWFMALYAEDRSQSGRDIAASMLHVRALQNAIRLHLLALGEHPAPPPSGEQQTLHDELEKLKAALDGHMAFIFQKASRNGLIMPMPGGRGMPWVHLAGRVQSDALAGKTPQALEHLRDMVEPAEQLRQATLPDMQALAASMQAQAEARTQRLALRDLIRQETDLLNHAQKRLSAEQPPPETDAQHKDISQMSTAELLSQLGMATAPAGASALNQDAVLRHADARQQDHATQYALRLLARTLNHRGETLTKKKMSNLLKAEKDMGLVLKSLATRQDEDSVKNIQTVLNDLSQSRHDMNQNQSEASKGSKGRLGFIPPPSSASSPDEQNGATTASPDDDPNSGQDDDSHDEDEKQPDNQDPLGRKMDDSPDSDAHIPDHERNRAHDIERELQRRASDRTRPQSELDYLNRLLAPLRQPH